MVSDIAPPTLTPSPQGGGRQIGAYDQQLVAYLST